MYKNKLDYETASKYLRYEPETGNLYRINTFRNKNIIGKIAGSKKYQSGKFRNHEPQSIVVTLFKKKYGAHSICWLLYYKEWPSKILDHKDGNPFNNRINNLREATYQQNNANTKLRKDNTSGFKGVGISSNKFKVQITFNRKKIHLGYFDTIEEAKTAYNNKAKELFGEFMKE